VNSRNSRFSHDTASQSTDISGAVVLVEFAGLVRRQLRKVATGALLLGAGAFLFAITRPRAYTSSVKFLLQAPKMPAGVPSLAAQLGLSLPTSDPGLSPAFFSEMIRSRAILSALADTVFEYRTSSGAKVRATLAEVYRVVKKDSAIRRDKAIERLQDAVSVRTSLNSGIISYSVVAPAADLAPRIASMLLDELNRFNTQRRQSQAAAERRFTEKRLGEVGVELREAEGALEEFLARNRVINSPQLLFAQDRLRREVELKRTLYGSVAQSHEQAKIEEVRDTPQITVIQSPEIPSQPDSRMLFGKTLAAAVFGAMIGLMLGYMRERLEQVTSRSIRETPVALPEDVKLPIG